MAVPPDRTSLRVVAWNMRGAIASSASWNYLLELKPDVALLQDVRAVPTDITDCFSSVGLKASWKDGNPQLFSTFVLVREGECLSDDLHGEAVWIDAELRFFAGNLISTRVQVGAMDVRVVSVYSPAWPIDPKRLAGFDTSGVKLELADGIWVADVLRAALPAQPDDAWIIGGDFNLSETFDWRAGPRGNREYLDLMTIKGYTECLRAKTGQVTPTFRNPRGGAVVHQIDHLFVSAFLSERLLTCTVGSAERVFEGNLSDHLPIIAEFDTQPLAA